MPKQDVEVLTDEDETKDETVVITEKLPAPPADDSDSGDEHEDDEDGDEKDERVVKRSDDEDANDAEREAIRERRRKEKLERKERKEAAIRRNNVEMDFLRKRNDDLERRLGGVESNVVKQQQADYDAAMQKAQRDFQMAEDVIAKATAAGNGQDVVTAMRYRDDARTRYNQIAQAKQTAEQQAKPAQTEQPKVDAVVLRHAQKFLTENTWYDPDGANEDSAIVLAIDNTLVREGYDPKSDEYWGELRKRAAKRLPERFEGAPSRSPAEGKETAARTPRGGPALGSTRDHAPQSTRKEIYLSPERKQALVDAGVWDDPVLRMKYAKKYAEYDKAHKKA